MQQEADREAARLSAIRDAEQQAFQEKESQARADLQKRLATEQRVIHEQQQRAREELDRTRRYITDTSAQQILQ